MIYITCPICYEYQPVPLETVPICEDLTKGKRMNCVKCGGGLAMVLVVMTRERLIARLKARKEGN